jgi:hypothetical protein
MYALINHASYSITTDTASDDCPVDFIGSPFPTIVDGDIGICSVRLSNTAHHDRNPLTPLVAVSLLSASES